jgi:hypothetical protein
MSDASGLEPDPTQSLDGIPDDRLSELERQVVAQFVAPDEALAPPHASSGTTPDPADPGTETPPEDRSEDSGVEGGEGEQEGVAPSTPPAAAIPPPPPLDASADITEGTEAPPLDRTLPITEWATEDQDRARALVSWADGLTEETTAQIDAITSGNYALVPVDDIPAITAFYQARQSGQTGTPPPTQAPAPAWEEDPDLPPPDPRFDQLQQRLEQTEAQVAAEAQTRQLELTRADINAGADEWFAQHPYLDATDRSRLESWVIDSGAYIQHASRHQPRQAVQQALVQALAVDPVVAQRRIDAQVADRLEQERAALASQTRQNAGSSALAGSGSVMAPGRQPLDPDAAMVETIRQAMQNGA